MKIKIIAVGKIKEVWIKNGIEEFMKRMKNVKMIEIKDSDPEQEQEKILSIIKENNLIVPLSEEGKSLTSIKFSHYLKRIENNSKDICFIIGGPNGLGKKLRKDPNTISLSNMTFTHEMARLFLVEQLYRAQTIQQNKNYHR